MIAVDNRLPEISKVRGVLPGAVLSRELKKRGLDCKQFALSLGEHPQTLKAILKGRHSINSALSIKLGEKLGVNSDYFMLLQAGYEEETRKKKSIDNQTKPNIEIFHKALFWDTHIDKIDWQRHKRAVIRRVFERGTETEINEIISFYGEKTITESLLSVPLYLPSLSENAKKYLGIDINSKQ